MKCHRYWIVLFSVLALCGMGLADINVLTPATSATSQPTASSSPATTQAGAATGEQLRQKALQALQLGDFSGGLTLLGDLGDDALAQREAALVQGYLKYRQADDAERAAQRLRARDRVQLAMLAEQYHPILAKTKLDAAELAHVQKIADSIAAAERLLIDNSATTQPETIRNEITEKLDAALAEAQFVTRLETGSATAASAAASAEDSAATSQEASDEGEDVAAAQTQPASAPSSSQPVQLSAAMTRRLAPWAQPYNKAVEELKTALVEYKAAWKDAKLPEDWPGLKRLSERAQDALLDMGVLLSREGISVALNYAREARDFSDKPEEFLQQEWVKALIDQAEKKGAQMLQDGKWMDALTLYGHAGELDRNNVDYQEKTKLINQHVRVIGLYGDRAGKSASGPASQPPAKSSEGEEEDELPAETRWREMIAGIDTAMVKNAISQIDANYVDNPDYRKMTLAALRALKVLAETTEAAASFPSLKDEAKRTAFLAAVDKQMDQVSAKNMVDNLDLALSLDRVLEANNKTLRLPDEVVDMEFAEGMTSELDMFSNMIWPYEDEDFQKRTMGSFYGIGVQIRKDPGKAIEVVTPLPDTPAIRAGILAGDYIQTVEGVETKTLTVDKAVKMITGPRHTKVKLTIQRPGMPKPIEMAVERDEIHMQTIKGWKRLSDGKWDYMLDPTDKIGYIRMIQFTGDTTGELHEALKTLRDQGVKGIILDLRFNPGGLLPTAVETADEFLTKGTIVRTKGRNSQEEERSANGSGEYQQGKLFVLINRSSASAAEILSGAMKDWGRATIIGERSYGKGSVQRLIPLRQKRARLKLTTAHYYLPSGRCLHRTNGCKVWGVDPDVAVDMTIRQSNRNAELRQEADLLKNTTEQDMTKLLEEQLHEDLQLETALVLLQLQLLDAQAVAPAQTSPAQASR